MIFRVRIDLAARTIEAEGDQEFVRAMVSEFRGLACTTVAASAPGDAANPPTTNGTHTTEAPKAAQRASSRSRGGKESHELEKNLDLLPKDGKQTLDDFFQQKAPKSAFEKNTVFVYYLKQVLGVEQVSVNSVFTCYRHMRTAMPEKLRQSLWDTGSKKGWLDTRDLNNLGIPIAGLNLVDQQLPRARPK